MSIMRATFVALGLAALLCGSAQAAVPTLTRNAAAGAVYGAPGPRTCSTMSEPRSGPISPAQARAYVICGYEKDYQGGSRSLYLIGQVQVQVGQGRPYEHVRDSIGEIDPHKKVYDIRGSSVTWTCSVPGQTPLPNSKLCRRTVNSTDEGKCFQTTFGDWRCTFADFNAPMSTDTRTLLPAPQLADVE